jgi:predicted lipoprotein with Yx(FWY)xxD motif
MWRGCNQIKLGYYANRSQEEVAQIESSSIEGDADMLKISRPLMLITSFAVLSLLLVACSPVSAAPAAVPTILVTKSATLGSILTDAKGKTLYMYTKDTPGVSNCYDKCAVNWPPLTIAAGSTPVGSADVTAKLGTTKRTDGTMQVTANDLPLYYWIKDVNPGDTTGQNVGGIWFVLDSKGSIVK